MSNMEFNLKLIEIAIAFVGLVLVIFGWIIPYRQSVAIEKQRADNEEELNCIKWRKELIDKQISQLYGPMYALIIEGNIQYARVLYQLGRKHIIPKNMSFYDLPKNEQKIWIHYVDTYKIPNQMRMVEIMRNNLHLIYNSEIPSSYKTFLDYALGWELLDNQKRNGVSNYYEYHYVYNYPTKFNKYIRTTLEELLEKQGELIRQSENNLVDFTIK